MISLDGYIFRDKLRLVITSSSNFKIDKPVGEPTDFWSEKPHIAQQYRVSLRTVDNWMRTGVIPYVKIGGVVRFDMAKVAAALARFEVRER